MEQQTPISSSSITGVIKASEYAGNREIEGAVRLTSVVTVALFIYTISNGNRTEWSPIRSVIIRVITKSDDRAAGVRFVYHEYDYRPNWTTRSPIAN